MTSVHYLVDFSPEKRPGLVILKLDIDKDGLDLGPVVIASKHGISSTQHHVDHYLPSARRSAQRAREFPSLLLF